MKNQNQKKSKMKQLSQRNQSLKNQELINSNQRNQIWSQNHPTLRNQNMKNQDLPKNQKLAKDRIRLIQEEIETKAHFQVMKIQIRFVE